MDVNTSNSSGKKLKNAANVSELITSECCAVNRFVLLAQKRSGRLLCKYDLLNQGGGVGRELSEKLDCETVDEKWDGLNLQRVVQFTCHPVMKSGNLNP